ncbi:hypothetical protein EK21DRAFT_117714 [Setomelanomma holmii]|uniref:Uncharacterized protein n=1 Tax=Setomelanomma holmii TaxID=210430 RepID=A0A9P4GZX6_9PLEO|nr:hypothetical protein EK21DRAFT_117714 [Setomelanomma holmii]
MAFPFLQLSTELRSVIYATPISYNIEGVKVIHRTDSSKARDVPKKLLFSLAHVCKQLRAEWLPLYLASLRIDLKLEDLNYFLCTFCNFSPDTTIVQATALKAITVYIDDATQWDANDDIPSADPLQFSKLRLDCPELTCAFDSDESLYKVATTPGSSSARHWFRPERFCCIAATSHTSSTLTTRDGLHYHVATSWRRFIYIR